VTPIFGRVHPLKTYAMLEAAVALWALFLWLFFDQLIDLFVPFLRAGLDSTVASQAARVLVAGCWILPATIPMGASFPAIVDALGRIRPHQAGRGISRFYSLNLLGAILGAIGGPFLLFPLLGLDSALLVTFLVDLAAALIALKLVRGTPEDGAVPKVPVAAASGTPSSNGLLLSLAAGSGFLFFSLEIVWTHLIGVVLGNSVYAFAAMLASVLIGLGLGGFLTTVRFRATQHAPVQELSTLLFAGALVLSVTTSVWPAVPDALASLGQNARSFGVAESIRWALAAVLIVPPATLLGALYPMLFRLDAFPSQGSGSVAGRIVAANALGCISGALVTGFLLIPVLGSERTLLVLTALIVVMGVAVARRAWRIGRSRRPLALGLAAVIILVALPSWDRLRLTSGKHVYFGSHEVFPQSRLRFFHEDTLGGITTVVDNPAGVHRQPAPYRTLLTNGKFQGNDSWEMAAQTGFALVPMLFVSDYDEALVIGLGTGRTAHIVKAMGFQSVDIAEIAPGIVEGARDYFTHINGSVLDEPKTRLILEDGRNVLLLRPKRYDLITIEISSIWFAGATNLFSREFYSVVRDRLTTTGVFQQWLQLHHISRSEIETVLVTMRSQFPEVSFWVVGGQGLLIASRAPQTIKSAFFERLPLNATKIDWSTPELRDRVRELAASRILAPEDVSRLASRGEAIENTDRNRRLEFFTPRYNQVVRDLRRENLRVLASLASFPPTAVDPSASGELADSCRSIERADYLRSLGLRMSARGVLTAAPAP